MQRADIVGHSLGSLIAQTFAEFWPERTRRVVLISSSGGPRPGAPRRKPAYDFAAQIRQLHEPIEADSPFMIEWWSSPTPVDPDFLRRQRRDAAAIPRTAAIRTSNRALRRRDAGAFGERGLGLGQWRRHRRGALRA